MRVTRYIPFVCIEDGNKIKVIFFWVEPGLGWSTIRDIEGLNEKTFIGVGKIYPRRIRSGLPDPVIWIEEKTLMQKGYSNVRASVINWGGDIIKAIENYCLPSVEDNANK